MRAAESIRQQMFAHIDEWQQSGLSQKAWCEQHNMRYHVFHYWYKCYRDMQSASKEPQFIPLNIQPSLAASAASIELLLPDGKRLLFHQSVSSDYLKALIG
jgi:hypothetical protein